MRKISPIDSIMSPNPVRIIATTGASNHVMETPIEETIMKQVKQTPKKVVALATSILLSRIEDRRNPSFNKNIHTETTS
jgi:hypothetical protein